MITPHPAVASCICSSCGPLPSDARIVHVTGHKRPAIQHRQHCHLYDPALKAEIATAGLTLEAPDWREALKPPNHP